MKVGDELWYVPADSRHENPEGSIKKVTKVGRKYFYIENGYHDMKCELWNNDGYNIGHVVEWPHGQIYQTQQDYLEYLEWYKLHDIRNMPLTREQKKAIVEIIKGG